MKRAAPKETSETETKKAKPNSFPWEWRYAGMSHLDPLPQRFVGKEFAVLETWEPVLVQPWHMDTPETRLAYFKKKILLDERFALLHRSQLPKRQSGDTRAYYRKMYAYYYTHSDDCGDGAHAMIKKKHLKTYGNKFSCYRTTEMGKTTYHIYARDVDVLHRFAHMRFGRKIEALCDAFAHPPQNEEDFLEEVFFT
jgi:hypothetical protein